MGGLIVTRDDDGLPQDPEIRASLKMLSQRGAKLVILSNGAAIEAPRKGADVAVAWVDATQIPALDAAGWLTCIGNCRFILSPAGRSIVRLMKAGPSPAEATNGPASAPLPPLPLVAARVAPESPLAWMRTHKDRNGKPLLNDEAFAAGERLRADFDAAQMLPRTTVDWEAIPRTGDERRGMAGVERERGGGAAAAQVRVRRALAALPPELVGIVMDVCCFGHGLQDAEKSNAMPRRSAHCLLGITLNMLARHYGLLPLVNAAWQPRTRPRHWGADSYRPTIDGA